MLNVIPMVTTRKIAIEYKQKKMRKEFKHFATKKKKKKLAKYPRKQHEKMYKGTKVPRKVVGSSK